MKSNRVKRTRDVTKLLISALLLTLVLTLLTPFTRTVRAAEATDEIEHFIITVRSGGRLAADDLSYRLESIG